MSAIVDVRGREILDSRGNPTVEAEVVLETGRRGRAAVPSGASTGRHEASELRDGDPDRYLGRGVLKAVNGIRTELRDALRGFEASEQRELDRTMIELDGTQGKGRLGANAVLAVSLAAARAAASERELPLYRYLGGGDAVSLPVPMMNIVNGGAHASNNVDIQEFMVAPAGAATFSEGLRMGVEVFHALKGVLAREGRSTAVGDEGGFAPDLSSDAHAAEAVVRAIEEAGYRPGEDLVLAVDAAASELFADGRYTFRKSSGESLATDGMIDFWEGMIDRFSLASVEDPLDEDDWDGWTALTGRAGGRCRIVGDDLFATNLRRLERGIRTGAANSILVKVNQIGTLSEALDAVRAAREAGLGTIISHRSGETEDTFIADLAVATGAGLIKTGAPSRTDRVAKYNQLLRIEEDLGARAEYGGRSVLALAVYFAVLGGDYSAFEARQAKGRLDDTRAQIRAVRHEVDSMRARTDSLRNNDEALERFARERYGFIRDGEYLYRISGPEEAGEGAPVPAEPPGSGPPSSVVGGVPGSGSGSR